METFNVGKIEEFENKSKKVVTIGDEEVGVFRLGDEFFAWRNICPHQGGPICQGRIFSLVLENIDSNQNWRAPWEPKYCIGTGVCSS